MSFKDFFSKPKPFAEPYPNDLILPVEKQKIIPKSEPIPDDKINDYIKDLNTSTIDEIKNPNSDLSSKEVKNSGKDFGVSKDKVTTTNNSYTKKTNLIFIVVTIRKNASVDEQNDIYDLMSKIFRTNSSAHFKVLLVGYKNLAYAEMDYVDTFCIKKQDLFSKADENWTNFDVAFDYIKKVLSKDKETKIRSFSVALLDMSNDHLPKDAQDILSNTRCSIVKSFDVRDSKLFSIEDLTFYENDFYYYGKTYNPVKRKEKKNIIAIAIENSSTVYEHKNEVLSVIDKITSNNKNCLFKILNYGSTKSFSDVCLYDNIKTSKSLENVLITNNDNYDCGIKEALSESLGIAKKDSKKIPFSNDFELSDVSIVFIGSGKVNSSEIKDARDIINKILDTKVKSLKYFCIHDTETVPMAALGFPIVGHLISDFYK